MTGHQSLSQSTGTKRDQEDAKSKTYMQSTTYEFSKPQLYHFKIRGTGIVM